MTIEQDQVLNNDEKSAVMTMRQWPLSDCSTLELRQLAVGQQ